MMYVKRYICPNKAYQWKLVKYIPVQFVGVRENIRYYLDLDDLEIIYFWKDEIVTEDTSSDYSVNWSRLELCETKAKIIFYFSSIWNEFFLNTPYGKLGAVNDLDRMKKRKDI